MDILKRLTEEERDQFVRAAGDTSLEWLCGSSKFPFPAAFATTASKRGKLAEVAYSATRHHFAEA